MRRDIKKLIPIDGGVQGKVAGRLLLQSVGGLGSSCDEDDEEKWYRRRKFCVHRRNQGEQESNWKWIELQLLTTTSSSSFHHFVCWLAVQKKFIVKICEAMKWQRQLSIQQRWWPRNGFTFCHLLASNAIHLQAEILGINWRDCLRIAFVWQLVFSRWSTWVRHSRYNVEVVKQITKVRFQQQQPALTAWFDRKRNKEKLFQLREKSLGRKTPTLLVLRLLVIGHSLGNFEYIWMDMKTSPGLYTYTAGLGIVDIKRIFITFPFVLRAPLRGQFESCANLFRQLLNKGQQQHQQSVV